MSFFELNPNLREQFAEQRAQNETRLQAQIAEQRQFREKLEASLKKRAEEAQARAAQPPHETVFSRIRAEMAARNTKEDGPTLEERLRTSR